MIQPTSFSRSTPMWKLIMIDGMTVRTMVWSRAATKTAAHSATMARTARRGTLGAEVAACLSAVCGCNVIAAP